MAPLGKAISVHAVPATKDTHLPAGERGKGQLFGGVVDPTWTIGSVANGGYVLGLILEACIQFQSTTPHVDLLHVTAHFLRTTLTAPFSVRICNIKSSSGYTNLTADLFQEGVLKIMVHVIFGVNAPHPRDNINLTLKPPSPYARRHPLPSHPSTATVQPFRHTWKFHKEARWAQEPEILARNEPHSSTRTNSSTIGGGGLEWGAWFGFTDKNERITTPSLAFLVDIFWNTPTLLPKSEKVGLTTSWYPTMVLSIEFKNPIPPPSNKHASRTVGLYSCGRFMTTPGGRHDTYVEVWTAPANLGEGEPIEGWRDDQFCIAIATQMALIVPMAVNEKMGTRRDAKL